VATSPADTSRVLKQEVARWADVVRMSNAK
jgi:hypothetical protein